MEKLVETINKLQSVVSTTDTKLDIPQIVVVGSQSTGKSSVLEHIVGKDFLPRGTDIVTRLPLVLQLVHLPEDAVVDGVREYAEFPHNEKVFTNFEEIRKEIENETFRIAGKNKGISQKELFLTIYSTNVPNLSLVDLPGITKVPVGEQPKEIEKLIRDLIMKYIKNKNAVILAVSSANVDVANSESLKIAKEVDPDGSRTIGILTKVDLMDSGTDCLDVIKGKIIPLKHGYIPVVNRGQKDILNNLNIEVALEKEREFFASHPSYRAIAHQCGTKYLSVTLSKLLINHIKLTLPDLRRKIHDMLAKAETELDGYGNGLTEISQSAMLQNIIRKYSNTLNSILEGKNQSLIHEQLVGGAIISCIFNENFFSWLQKSEEVYLNSDQITTAIRNSRGITGNSGAIDIPFRSLTTKQILKLLEPSYKCADEVHLETTKIIKSLSSITELQRYPKLSEKLSEVSYMILTTRINETKKFIRIYIETQASFINTNHPDFKIDSQTEIPEQKKPKEDEKGPRAGITSWLFGGSSASQESGIVVPQVSAKEKSETEMVKQMIRNYTDIVKRATHDYIPKVIMHNYINFIMENMDSLLGQEISSKQEVVEAVMTEGDDVSNKRKEVKALINVLREAQKILNEIKDY